MAEAIEVLNISEGELGFSDEIMKLGAEELLDCIQCAKCAAACPMVLAGFEFFNKRIIQSILIGQKEILLDDSSIWACQACNRCTEVCPRKVEPFGVVMAMRRSAIREFALPTLAVEGLKSLYDVGHAVYFSNAGEIRKKIGLPEKPPTTASNAQALKELRILMNKSALSSLGIIPMDSGLSDVTCCEV
ncbi:heterodisulfide reductase subunit C-like protein [Thermodesulfobium narugense DSM 14796]|uniref:Heterodisulfide reductase subunit C-like protein n=1 Tax=Thermodesulfobium narugense DSM 14796 TaxID=747365 RepID=M1E845_9BACT|nr:4Fe-4S dicluster domain-containing protein [Thermodesulfobium narugense]AEE14948.1 heterodisulfide reductase subunit C-like protein [Thermodesulfobium narugense DSM 14796]